MMISSKGRYALRVMVFLAEHNSDEYVPLKEISEGTLAPVSCLKDDAVPCDRAGDCCTLPIWKGLAELVDKYFDSMTLKEVAENARQQMIQNQRSNEKS